MRLTPETYRDDANQLLDDIGVEGSTFERVVLVRDAESDSATIRGRTTDDRVIEHEVEMTGRQYFGLELTADTTVHDDIRAAMQSIGWTIEVPTDEDSEHSPTSGGS